MLWAATQGESQFPNEEESQFPNESQGESQLPNDESQVQIQLPNDKVPNKDASQMPTLELPPTLVSDEGAGADDIPAGFSQPLGPLGMQGATLLEQAMSLGMRVGKATAHIEAANALEAKAKAVDAKAMEAKEDVKAVAKISATKRMATEMAPEEGPVAIKGGKKQARKTKAKTPDDDQPFSSEEEEEC
jgi:hypothetical protein